MFLCVCSKARERGIIELVFHIIIVSRELQVQFILLSRQFNIQIFDKIIL